MSTHAIFAPVLVQIFLTLTMFILLGARKVRAIKAGGVDLAKTALHSDAWPDDVLKVSNNISNQFESPVLFYTLAFVLFLIDAVDTAALVLAWTYAASRIVHAWIHVTSNYVPWRFRVFLFGMFVLIGLAGLTAYRLAIL